MWEIIKQIFFIIWQLPQIIVALVMWPFMGTKKLIRKENYCWIYECSKMSGGISLGCFIYLSPSCAKKEEVIRHELGHIKQSHMLSWLYLIVIGLPSILWATFHGPACYYSFYTENWANKLMGLSVTKWCTLRINEKNKKDA